MKDSLTGWRRPLGFALPLLIALVAAAAVACGGGGDGQVSQQLAPDQELRQRIAADPGTFDPQLASVAEEISIVKQLFRGLFTYDEELNVVPAVALELPTKANGGISEDGLTYTIKLRTDATWSDGAPVTAGDFAYAFQRLFDPEAGAQGYYFSFYTSIEGAEAAAFGEGPITDVQVSALDDYTLQIQLAQQQPTLPVLLALWSASPLRQDVIEEFGDAWTEPGNLIGNGPFVLAQYAPEDRVVLEANVNYQGDDQPTLQRIVYRIIPEDSAALLAYQNNEIDVTVIPPADSARFEGDPEQVRYAQLETFAILYNHQQAPFDDVLVGRAFSLAVDRDAYVAVVRGGVGAPALSWLPPGMPGSNAEVGANLSFNPEVARDLLAEAGYLNGEGFPTVTFTVADDPTNRLTAEFLQGQLSEHLGIDVQIETLEEDAFFDRLFEGDFQMSWLSWFADYADPENWLPQWFGTDGSFNVLGYSDPVVDELLEKAASAQLDQADRLSLYDQVHRIIIEDQALTPIFHPERNYLVKPHVAGLITTALDAEPGDWFATNVQILDTGDQPPASEPEE